MGYVCMEFVYMECMRIEYVCMQMCACNAHTTHLRWHRKVPIRCHPKERSDGAAHARVRIDHWRGPVVGPTTFPSLQVVMPTI